MRDRRQPCGYPARVGVDLVAVRGLADMRQPLHGERITDAERLEQADGDRRNERGAVTLGRRARRTVK